MEDRDKRYKAPQGTVVLMIVFILLIIALWGSTYLTLLSRGVTGPVGDLLNNGAYLMSLARGVIA
ncbi:MAG: hypothetical protein KC421_06770 [Anaerolineales bacterium]|nr:hypothetical protein [Anaerolineales bacterium]